MTIRLIVEGGELVDCQRGDVPTHVAVPLATAPGKVLDAVIGSSGLPPTARRDAILRALDLEPDAGDGKHRPT